MKRWNLIFGIASTALSIASLGIAYALGSGSVQLLMRRADAFAWSLVSPLILATIVALIATTFGLRAAYGFFSLWLKEIKEG